VYSVKMKDIYAVKQGLVDIQTYLDSLSSETAGKLTIFEAKFMTEKHITQ